MKNLRSLFAALMLLCSTMAFAEKVEIGGITYDLQKTLNVEEYRAKVVAGSSKYAGDIVVPTLHALAVRLSILVLGFKVL